MRVSKPVFTSKRNTLDSNKDGSEVRLQLQSSRVMTLVELGQEVRRLRFFICAEIAHQVGLLLPGVSRFLEFHFTLKRKTTLKRCGLNGAVLLWQTVDSKLSCQGI